MQPIPVFRHIKSLAILLALGGAVFGAALWHVRAATAPTPLPHSVPNAIAIATLIGPLAATTPISITVALQPRNAAGLQQFVLAASTPGNALFRHFLTPAQYAAQFGPAVEVVTSVESWLQGRGWQITRTLSGGEYVTASATAAQVQATFGVALMRYRAANGAAFYANPAAIQVPAALAPQITSIVGLDNVPLEHPSALVPAHADNVPASPLQSASACPGPGNGNYYIPSQLAKAYEFPPATGSGHPRLALVEFDGYIMSDIAAFAQCFAPGANLATAVHNRLVDAAAPLPTGDGASEVELDLEIALAMAPPSTQVDVYEAPNSGQGALDIYASLANDNLDDTISISWGSCEAGDGGAAAVLNTTFQQLAAQGQAAFAAAGDTGAYDCLTNDGTGSGDPTVSIDFPASSPYAIAVGGTTLQTGSNGAYLGETAWNDYANYHVFAASGGGVSQIFAAPTWQVQSQANGGAGAKRAAPDVAADADPYTGYMIYCTVSSSCTAGNPGWLVFGGTSAAAPLWAALNAFITQSLNARAGLITPALYTLYGADANHTGNGGLAVGGTTFYDYAQQVNGASPSGAIVLHDITTGTNGFPNYGAGFTAQRGFDDVSGVGTMHGQTLVNYLAKMSAGSGPSPTPTSTPTVPIPTSPTPAPTIPPGTTPQLYLVGQGSNQGYWLSTYLPGLANGNWSMIDPTAFQGSPALTDDGTGNLWLAGVGTDGQIRYGRYVLTSQSFGGWSPLPGMTCVGAPALSYAQQTLFITCRTTSNAIAINAFNTTAQTWGGWAIIGGGLQSSPTMATDGQTLLIVAQAPQYQGDESDWYTFYTIGSGATTIWRNFLTTCQDTPSVAWQGAGSHFSLACVANDTSSVWTNVLTATPTGSTLTWWVNAGAPAGRGLQRGAAVITDRVDTQGYTFLVGMGLDRAAYVTQQQGATWAAWQRISLPGIFAGAIAADYWGH